MVHPHKSQAGAVIGTRSTFDVILLPDELAARIMATWQYAEWGKSYRDSFNELLSGIKRSIGSSTIPVVFVATTGREIIGTASIIENDLPSREDINPWLASIFVVPEWRMRGVASALVRTALAHARSLHVDKLYLFTHDLESLYAKFGFEKVDSDEFMREQVSIMMHKIT